MKVITFISLIISCMVPFGINAQSDDCEVVISTALSEYDRGHFYAVPDILVPCLDKISNEQKQRVYMLLTQTYLLLDDQTAARQSYLNLLSANPEFSVDTALHAIDVIYLSKKFTASPIFSWYGSIGTNATVFHSLASQSTIGNRAIVSEDNYQPGLQLGGGLDFRITDQLSVRGGLTFQSLAYTNNTSKFFKDDVRFMRERQSWITSPFAAVYSKALGRFRPYGYVGYAFQYLLSSTVRIDITNDRPFLSGEEGTVVQRERVVEPSRDLNWKYRRNHFNHSVMMGGGIKMKFGLNFIFVDLNYSVGLKNLLNRDNAFADYGEADRTSTEFSESMDATILFMYADDYFRLDNVALSFGFIKPLYKPRELKRARTKNIAKQISRQ